jgi:hypothetical protein
MPTVNNIIALLDVMVKLILRLFLIAIMCFFIYSLFDNKPNVKPFAGSITLTAISGYLLIYGKYFDSNKKNQKIEDSKK